MVSICFVPALALLPQKMLQKYCASYCHSTTTILTKVVPQYYSSITTLSLQYYHSNTTVIFQYYNSITTVLPQDYYINAHSTTTVILPQTTVLIPQYYYSINTLIPTVLPQYYHSTTTTVLPQYVAKRCEKQWGRIYHIRANVTRSCAEKGIS